MIRKISKTETHDDFSDVYFYEEPVEIIPPVSIYSDITDEALEIIHSQYTAKYAVTLNDEDKNYKERSLETLVKAVVKPEKVNEEIHAVQEFVKEYLYRQLKELALIIYLAMDKRKDFGEFGEQRVNISFVRNILKIPNNRQVTQFDANRFRRIIDECDNRHGNKSGDEYLTLIKDRSVTLFNKTYPCHSLSNLDQILNTLNTPFTIYRTHHIPYQTQFILAECETMQYDKYTAYMFKREYIRSPQKVLSSVAQPYENGTMVRREAAEVIAFNKYQTYLIEYAFRKDGKAYLHDEVEHVNHTIRDNLTKQVFLSFGIDLDNTTYREKREKYKTIKDSIIAEMEDGVLWNQIGSIVYQKKINPVHNAFRYCLTDHKNYIYYSVFADWLPKQGKYQGAMARFCEIAEFDPERANRDILMYLSDNWFTDENDFMLKLTNVCAGLVVPFINNDFSVDFTRMSKEITSIYHINVKHFTTLIEKLFAILHKSHYQVGLYYLDYKGLEDTVYKMYQKSINAKPLEELRLFGPFWINIHGYLKKWCQEGYEEFQAVLAVGVHEFESIILKHFTGKKSKQYHNSLREYIFTRFLEMGLIPKEHERDAFAYIEKVRTNDEYDLAYNSGVICLYNSEIEKALEYFNTALEKNNESAEALYKRGLIHKENKNTKAARLDFKAASEYSNSILLTVMCLSELGDLFSKGKEKKEAIDYYTRAFELDPKNIKPLLKRGDAYSKIGDYISAINDFTKVLKINNNCIEAYKKRGAAYQKLDNAEESKKDYAMAAYYNGLIYFEKKDYENSIKEFRRAISYNNTFEDALMYLAFSYHNNNNLEEALDAYCKIILVNPNNYDAWHKRGRLNRDYKKDIVMAINDFSRAITIRSDLPDAYEDRGDLFHSQGKYGEAVDDFNVCINITSTAFLYNKRGLAHAYLHDRDNAIKDYSLAIKNKPDYMQAYMNRGFTYNNVGEYDKAIADFTRGIELAPNDERNYYYRGIAHQKKFEYQEAINDFSIAIEKYPQYFDAWLERANIKRLLNDLEGALKDYEELVRLNPANIDIRIEKAMLYCDLHNYEKAIQTLSETLQISPDSIIALKTRGACYKEVGLYDNAINDYKNAIILLFNMVNKNVQADILQKGSELFKAEKYSEAAECFKKEIEQDPGNALLVFNRSLALIMSGNYKETASILSNIEWPNHNNEIYHINRCFSELRLIYSFIEINNLKSKLHNNASCIDSYLKLGTAYQTLFSLNILLEEEYGKTAYSDVIDIYQSVLKKEPGNEKIWFEQGKFYESYAEYCKILYGVEGISIFDGKNHNFTPTKRNDEEIKHLNLAIDNYTKALQLKPDFIEALERRAKVHQIMGFDKKAEADLTGAIEAAKNNCDIQKEN